MTFEYNFERDERESCVYAGEERATPRSVGTTAVVAIGVCHIGEELRGQSEL